jgi:hypothetical protein
MTVCMCTLYWCKTGADLAREEAMVARALKEAVKSRSLKTDELEEHLSESYLQSFAHALLKGTYNVLVSMCGSESSNEPFQNKQGRLRADECTYRTL